MKKVLMKGMDSFIQSFKTVIEAFSDVDSFNSNIYNDFRVLKAILIGGLSKMEEESLFLDKKRNKKASPFFIPASLVVIMVSNNIQGRL